MPEVIIVGGGIAGASCAYFLAQRGVTDVVILEREDAPAQHASGRSAAVVHQIDGIELVQRLKILGMRFLREPPNGFAEQPLVDFAGSLAIFGDASWCDFEPRIPSIVAQGALLEALTPTEARARVEVLDPNAFAGAAFTANDGNIDVHELMSAFLRHARHAGGELRCNVEVSGAVVESGRCVGVHTNAGELRAPWVVNAAGAWAGTIAAMAGAAPIEVRPLRRCAVTFRPPADVDITGWPLVASDDHLVYFKPESGRLLMSPMDEAPSEPRDARCDDETIAAGIERLGQLAPRIVPRSVERKWAGLRTFAPDRIPVVGEDPIVPGLFWLAGQGGFGIETSPILGAIAADLLVDGRTDRFDAAALSPRRFSLSHSLTAKCGWSREPWCGRSRRCGR